MAEFERLLPAKQLQKIMAAHAPLARRPPKVSACELLVGLVYHVSQGRGSLGGHLEDLTGSLISDSAASQRRLAMPWAIFEAVLEQALAPLADPALHPSAFYAGLRLVGLDGTQFSLSNTPRILGTMTKAASRRFDAAFAKLGSVVLVELGTHAPLAAAIGAPGENESEAELAAQVLGALPPTSLLLADRYHGNAAFLARLLAGTPTQAFLVRVSQTPRPRLIEELADGSALIEVRLAREEAAFLERDTLLVREVRGRVRRPKGAWSEVRLWTSLTDVKAHPALELLSLYARRWEQELAYHELKVDLRASGDAPLASHTLGDRCPGSRRPALSSGASGPSAPASGHRRRGGPAAGELWAGVGGPATLVGRAQRGRRLAQRRATPGTNRARHRPHRQTAAASEATSTRQPAHRAPAREKLAAHHQHSTSQRRVAV